ncbi:MAG: TIGR04133 family radical SAM/SPASM protein [Marinilabiliaceae bacterium]|nr:TIGR04133 family radical SAM/SPASM protein [Marinilabiliaceae bacterium]
MQLSLRKRIALTLFQRFKRNESKIHQLRYILWECTLRCNLSCVHCGSDCKKDAQVKDMPAEDFLRAIDEIIPIVKPNETLIVFTGGEALLRKDLEKVGEKLYQRGFPWGIVSNGFHLNQERLNSLANAGLRSMTISLDGLKESHNWMRGHQLSFDRAWNAILLLTKIKDVKYDVVTCVNQRNFNELHHIYKMLVDAGVKEWRIFTVFPIGRAKEIKELQLSSVEFANLFDFIKQVRKEKKIKLNYGCEGFLGNYESEVRDNFFFCRAGVNIASVLVDGSISACPNLRSNFIQGNIYKDNFAEVWENRYEKFRDRSWTKTGLCADCDFFKYCEGNAMHLRDEKNGELLFCHLKRIEEGQNIDY